MNERNKTDHRTSGLEAYISPMRDPNVVGREKLIILEDFEPISWGNECHWGFSDRDLAIGAPIRKFIKT